MLIERRPIEESLTHPNLKTLKDVFSLVWAYDAKRHPRTPLKWEVGMYCMVNVLGRNGNEEHRTSCNVRLTPALIAWCKENMLSELSFYVELIQWNDGRTLVALKYDQILGQRYLCVLDPVAAGDPQAESSRFNVLGYHVHGFDLAGVLSGAYNNKD